MGDDICLKDILAHFEAADWPVDEVNEAEGRVYTTVRGRNVLLDLEVALNQEWQLLQVTVTLPELVPSRRLAEALALVNRINFNLPVGHFEVNLESRQIGYYTAVPINGLPFVHQHFETLLAWAIDIVDEEHPRIMQVLYADTPAEEATPAGEGRRQRRFDA